jgi:hypothetical protein
MRSLRLRLSVRGMLKAVAITAICLWPVHYCYHLPEYRAIAQTRGFMS